MVVFADGGGAYLVSPCNAAGMKTTNMSEPKVFCVQHPVISSAPRKDQHILMKPFPIVILAATLAVTLVFAQMQSLTPTDTFSAAKLSPQEIREVISGVEESAYDTPQSWEKELRIRRVNLGKAPGLIVEGTGLLCGGTGNCQTWVFRKVNGNWLSMFAGDQAPVAESFQFEPSITRGIKDFAIKTNSSAEVEKRVTYKFDGRFYRASHP